MATVKERVWSSAIRLLRDAPNGLRYADLIRAVSAALPDVGTHSIRTFLWALPSGKPELVYRAKRGLFRHTTYGDTQLQEELREARPGCAGSPSIRKKRAAQFEEDVKAFLQRLGFDEVDGASGNLMIGGVQVDVIGRHENTTLVVECTTRQELGLKSLREKIQAVRGVHLNVRRGLEADQRYRGSTAVFVLATKNIELRHEDIEFANQGDSRVYIWDEDFIEYYDELFGKIGSYARFSLLGEMGVRPSMRNTVSVPAFRARIADADAYILFVNPKDILEFSFVARRGARQADYYQRILSSDRIGRIASYINRGNVLPNNLILAFDEHVSESVKFHQDDRNLASRCTSGRDVAFGILEFPRDYRSCWVIDGQHRLYAFVEAQVDLMVPVLVFHGLPLAKQAKMFLDINKNQKPVSPDLVWDLNGDMIPDEEEGVISNVVKELARSGPLGGRIYVPSRGGKPKGLLRMAGLCIALQRMRLASQTTHSRTVNPFWRETSRARVREIARGFGAFLERVQLLFAEDWRRAGQGFCLHNTGMSVLVRLFERIVSTVSSRSSRAPYDEDFDSCLGPVVNYLEQKYGDSTALRDLKRKLASEAGKDEVAREFMEVVARETRDPKFAPGRGESGPTERIKNLEGRLKSLANHQLAKEHGPQWFGLEKVVPRDIRSRALRNQAKHGGDDVTLAYQQMTFGDCCKVIESNKRAFERLFVRRDGRGFDSWLLLLQVLQFVSRVRGSETHDIGTTATPDDLQLLEIYLRKLNTCIDAVLGPSV